jgi:O-Antigen ligase
VTIVADQAAPAVVSNSHQDQVPAPADRRRISHRSNVVKVVISGGIAAMPLLVPAGPGNTAPADLFLAIAVVISIVWLAGKRHAMRFPYLFPVGLSVLAGALASTVVYAHAYNSVGGGLISLLQDLFVVVWGLVIANLGRDAGLLKTITRAWVISASCWAALMIIGVLGHVALLSGETARNGVRAAFTLGDPNLAANYFICSLLMLRATRFPRRRVVRWACGALLLAAIGLTGSNGGAVVLIVTAILGALFRMAQRRGAVPAIIAASALALVALAILPNVHVSSIVQKAQQSSQLLQDSIGRQAESSGSRSTILSESLRLYVTQDTPLGIGPGGTKVAFQSHLYSYVKMAHDDYTAAIIERGWLGGFALICLLVIVAARCRRIASRPLRSEYAAIFPRPELLAAAVVGMAISATLYQVLHFRHLWALLGVVAAVDLWGRRDSNRGQLREHESAVAAR